MLHSAVPLDLARDTAVAHLHATLPVPGAHTSPGVVYQQHDWRGLDLL